MKIAVLGVGLIGGSIGLAARRRLDAEVVGWGRSPERLQLAVELGAIGRAAGSLAEACEGVDLVFCCAPVAALPEQGHEALAAAGPETAVTDVGSTKGELVAALGEDERFIGGHPLAGAETAGVENAREDLFEGARWYLTPTDRSSGLLYDRLQRALAALGARPQAIDPQSHDRLMATVSHLPARARQRARLRGGPLADPRLRAAPRRRPELSRRHPRRRFQPGDLGRHLRRQPRRPSPPRSTRSRSACARRRS